MQAILEDIRYALRQFRKVPGFTATAVLTLALGIGATTAIFTLVHAVLLKSLPVANPDELWRVGDNENCCINGGMQDNWSLFSYDQYKMFRENNPEFEQMAGFQAGRRPDQRAPSGQRSSCGELYQPVCYRQCIRHFRHKRICRTPVATFR